MVKVEWSFFFFFNITRDCLFTANENFKRATQCVPQLNTGNTDAKFDLFVFQVKEVRRER